LCGARGPGSAQTREQLSGRQAFAAGTHAAHSLRGSALGVENTVTFLRSAAQEFVTVLLELVCTYRTALAASCRQCNADWA